VFEATAPEIVDAATGCRYMTGTGLPARRASGPVGPSPPGDLTTREREIIDLLAEGASDQQITRSLGISFKTCKPSLPAS
jgi:DNA-binding NarL/FixJ family response regulator